MLAPLDNETIFKKAFTDKDVFQQFIKDLFDIDIVVDKIETEKQFEPPLSPINIKLDIYAETTDHNFIIEIQKIAYDTNFDRFLHYFLTLIANQQKSSSDYKYKQQVLGVVVFARPYKFDQKTGEPIRDNVMIIDFNPRNLKGEIIKIYDHSMYFLNPTKKYQNDDTPKKFQDWLDLFYASMKDPVNYKLNLNNKGIAKAINIIDYEKLDRVTLQKMKEDELKKEMELLNERSSKKEGAEEQKIEIAVNLINKGYNNEIIKDGTKLTDIEIDKLRNDLKNK